MVARNIPKHGLDAIVHMSDAITAARDTLLKPELQGYLDAGDLARLNGRYSFEELFKIVERVREKLPASDESLAPHIANLQAFLDKATETPGETMLKVLSPDMKTFIYEAVFGLLTLKPLFELFIPSDEVSKIDLLEKMAWRIKTQDAQDVISPDELRLFSKRMDECIKVIQKAKGEMKNKNVELEEHELGIIAKFSNAASMVRPRETARSSSPV